MYYYKYFSLEPKLSDILKLEGKFYEFFISPFLLDNVGRVILFLLMILLITLLIFITIHCTAKKIISK